MENISGSAKVLPDVNYNKFLDFGFIQEQNVSWSEYLYREYIDKNGAKSKIIVDKKKGMLFDCFASSYAAIFDTFNLLVVQDLVDAGLIEIKEKA